MITKTKPQIWTPQTINRGQICMTGEIPTGLQCIQTVMPLKVVDQKTVISEEAGIKGRKVLRITGIFQKGDEPNENFREYPMEIIEPAVKAIQEDVTSRAVMGEYDHPKDAKLHLDRVSHLITKLWVEGKYVYGEAEVLEDMPYGHQLATLLRHNVRLGISSRGVGEVEEVFTEDRQQKYIVKPGYSFVTWDIVGKPSVTEAVMHVMESKDPLARGIITRAKRAKFNPQAELLLQVKKFLGK